MQNFLHLRKIFSRLPLSYRIASHRKYTFKAFNVYMKLKWNNIPWYVKYMDSASSRREKKQKMVVMGTWNNVFAFDQQYFFLILRSLDLKMSVIIFLQQTCTTREGERGRGWERNWKLCCMCKNVVCDKTFPLQTFSLLVPHLTAVNFYTPHFMLRCCAI